MWMGEWPPARPKGKLMYHGTDFPIEDFNLSDVNPSSGDFDICLTDCDGIAEMYATRFEGMGDGVPTIIELELASDLNICTEEDAMRLLERDPEAMTSRDIFYAIDSNRAAIVAAGYDGVEYRDCLPGTADEFTCTRIYTRDAVEILDSWEV